MGLYHKKTHTSSAFSKFSYSVPSRQGIPEDPKLGGSEGKENEQKRDDKKDPKRPFFGDTTNFWGMKELGFKEIRQRRRDKEDGNVDPIGGFSDHAVVGVKEDGDQS